MAPGCVASGATGLASYSCDKATGTVTTAHQGGVNDTLQTDGPGRPAHRPRPAHEHGLDFHGLFLIAGPRSLIPTQVQATVALP